MTTSRKRQLVFVFGSQACVPDDGLLAARQLQCETTVLGARLACCMSADLVDRFERVDLRHPAEVVEAARRIHASRPVAGVVAYDDQAVPVAARIAAALGLRGHPVAAADAARDKALMKERFRAAGLPIANYHLARDEDDAVAWAEHNGYPVVVKPVRGSASQGVIRADDEQRLREAYRRLRRIVLDYRLDTGARGDAEQLVESYLDGPEYSVELLVKDGVPTVLCLFEKPQPLAGPFFEETIYVTPPRLSAERQQEMSELAVRGAQALGLRDGAAHCEIRLANGAVFILEIGARLIGGACSRVFRHVLGEDIHPHILRLALGEAEAAPRQQPGAAGAMMIPIPKAGRLRGVHGVEAARQVPGIDDLILNTSPGELIVPFPEQSCYVGFITASRESAEEVEAALVQAAGLIELELDPACCETWGLSIADHRSYRPPAELGVQSCGGGSIDAAERAVLPLVAATYFAELPPTLGLEKARQCFTWFREGNRGATSPEDWFVAAGKGVALGSRRGETCHVSLLGVLPGDRRSGLGQALVRSVMAHYAAQGCNTMEINVEPFHPSNTAFFRELGFVPVDGHGDSCCSC
jgi:biotin carboxylase/GNAT superfamily N-acetyltransferase